MVCLCFRFATESTLLQMIGFIIRLAILPHFPEDSEPAVDQDAIGVSVRIAVGANFLPVSSRPALSLKPKCAALRPRRQATLTDDASRGAGYA